ncbi:DNA polymerase zeta subunit 2 [Drosophila takahashii]|uniref:DNA polymerase zeta subunit 2 n=1 Tax=Drosophila takahashii TaxID=29030 RepID=UPI001CF84A97|nr:DNA polymerase zeta processivity subunit [Drosophila takahashii]
MQAENEADIIVEALEVLVNHILYARGIYPAHIFKMKRMYNTPVFVSIFPPLNNYLTGVFRSAQELLRRRELQGLELILFQKENEQLESYKLSLECREDVQLADDHLMEFEQKLRAAIYQTSERLNQVRKLPAGSCQFKVHLHTTQEAFIRLSHESQYQEFPWLQAPSPKAQMPSQTLSLLPLASVESVGLKMEALILN